MFDNFFSGLERGVSVGLGRQAAQREQQRTAKFDELRLEALETSNEVAQFNLDTAQKPIVTGKLK